MNCTSHQSLVRLTAVATLGVLFSAAAALSQTPISCGVPISSNTVVAAEIDEYTYVGTAGQVVSVMFNWNWFGCGGVGEVDIYYPGSGVPATNVTAACTGTNIDLTLPSSGTYYFLVHQQGYNGTGAYQLNVQSISGGGCNPTPIVCGQPLSSNLTYAVESDPYQFVGTAGQVVSVMFNWNWFGCGGVGEVDIYYPGSTVPATNVTAACTGTNIDLTLPSSGTYALFVHQQGYNGTGAYQLNVQSISGGGCNPTPIDCGQPLSSNITYATESDPYTFVSTAGQTVLFTFNWNQFGCGSVGEMDIYYPGSTVPATNVTADCTGTEITLTLPTCGTYALFVHQQGYNGTDNYSISLACLGAACSNTINTSSSPVVGGSTSGGGTYNCCSTVTLCAEPAPCYNFVNWTDQNSDVVSTSFCYTFIATNNSTLTAHFAPTGGITNQICNFQVLGSSALIWAQSVAGDNYQVQTRASMTTGSWANISGVVLSNSPGGLIILTNSGGAVGPQKFYRLQVTP
jgi:hypothetical protein